MRREVVWLVALWFAVRAEHYRCTHKYVLSSLDSSYGGEQCLRSAPPLVISVGESGCTSLHYLLQGYNSVIGYGDCLELQFMPGEYWLSSLTDVQISYSTVLSAPWGGVSMTCRNEASESGPSQGDSPGNLDEAAVGANVMMEFVQTMGTKTEVMKPMFVTINSISFRKCPKRLQFNFVSNITIVNSSFE